MLEWLWMISISLELMDILGSFNPHMCVYIYIYMGLVLGNHRKPPKIQSFRQSLSSPSAVLIPLPSQPGAQASASFRSLTGHPAIPSYSAMQSTQPEIQGFLGYRSFAVYLFWHCCEHSTWAASGWQDLILSLSLSETWAAGQPRYPLVTYIAVENHIFNGKMRYKWSFSIAMS